MNVLYFIAVIQIIAIIVLRNDVRKPQVIIRKISEVTLIVVSFYILYQFENIRFDIFEGDESSSLQFNIITINSIIAGFLFTSLSIIISVSEKEIIKKLYNVSILDNIMYNLIIGIGSSLLSIIMAIILLFMKIENKLCDIIYIVQINSIAISIVFFCFSFLDILYILRAIKPKDDTEKQERINSTISKLKGNK